VIRVVVPPGETSTEPRLRVEEGSLDPAAATDLRDVFARHAANMAWYQQNAHAVRAAHPGMCVAVMAGEAFAGRTPAEADAMTRATHPDTWNSAFRLFVRVRLTG
jgi:hypothetical protein